MATRPLSSQVHPSSSLTAAATNTTNPSSSQTANSPLAARIAEKKRELADLRELRDLSGQLASQMQQLEQKLDTLAGGTEAVAAVLGNWHAVLRAIGMASMKVPKPKDVDGQETKVEAEDQPELPQTLVRIPVQSQQGAP